MIAHWFLPSGGGGRHVGLATVTAGRTTPTVTRAATADHLAAIGVAAEQAGFTGVLTPTGSGCEDAWMVCSAVAQHTRTLEFIVAFRPGFIAPTLAAQQAASFSRLTGGRPRLNIVTGGDPAEQRAYGDFLDHGERYERTDEFLQVLRQMWSGVPFDFEGKHIAVQGAGLKAPLAEPPPIYFGGASDVAEEVASRLVDTYLTWGEPPSMVGARVHRMRDKAASAGRTLRFGIRLHVITRDTEAEAWAEAQRILDGMEPGAIQAAQERYARMDSVGQARMTSLHGGTRDSLEIAPNLWAGIGLVREGAATALVGSHEQVADRLREYEDLGFDEVILSGYPHLEEAWRVGENVLPLLDLAAS